MLIQSFVISYFKGRRNIFLMKINELEALDLHKLHLHCITVEYISAVPAMLFGFWEISVYAY